MALFNDEAKETVRPEPSVKPLSVRGGAVPAPVVEDLLPPPSEAFLTPSRSRTCLDANSEVSGKLNFEEPARIDGRVDGEINANDGLTIGKSAVVTAKIKAVSIIVEGTVSGEISASQRIELYASARVSGNLTAPKIVVHEGALLEGHCTTQPQGAREDRKVGMLGKEARTLAQDNVRNRANSQTGAMRS